ncbi:hypothetical protein ALC57_06514 [Trachymyrmex cornetzi]|uniref:Uncharacterized protein n=1 Tax=Trachymyrmex cornetzi TaxID=471704 RepID=A0A151J8D6_9HYME|nr:hypothetical protein ALC57_06514 [Trachymyrmex cornetzi]
MHHVQFALSSAWEMTRFFFLTTAQVSNGPQCQAAFLILVHGKIASEIALPHSLARKPGCPCRWRSLARILFDASPPCWSPCPDTNTPRTTGLDIRDRYPVRGRRENDKLVEVLQERCEDGSAQLQNEIPLHFKVMPTLRPVARHAAAAASLPSNRVLCNLIGSITRAVDRCAVSSLSLGHL